nr:peroxidase [Yponomeuta cagnagella]
MYFLFFLAIPLVLASETVPYSRYNGSPLNETQIELYNKENSTEKCAIEVKPCEAQEGRRVDGTCNNRKYPTRGSAGGPFLRLLPPLYGKNGTLRTAKCGSPLPSARRVRNEIQSTGRVVDKKTFNMAAVHYAGFSAADVTAINGILDYTRVRTHCCQPEGKSDPRCIPIEVADDDPYLRSSDIRCLNFSRAESFQDDGCLTGDTPEKINFATSTYDLSGVYGIDEKALANIRTGKDGLLKMEERGGRYVPLGDAGNDICYKNLPNETTCYRFGSPTVGNFDLRLATLEIFFMREHNRIARELKRINPCWQDDRLFNVARQINIAEYTNMLYYELWPILMGYQNMVSYDLLLERVDFINKCEDEEAVPLVFTEFEIALRFFHTFVDGRIKMYDDKYHYSGEYSISDTLFRLAVIEEGKNFEGINRGTFYQNSALMDDIQDPDICEHFYGNQEKASDLPAIDIQRGRDMGVRPYNDYREMSGLKRANTFDDFGDVMSEEKIYALKNMYQSLDDVDLMAGIMCENFKSGAFVGPTLFSIMTKQLHLLKHADRFWFERGDQPHSLNLEQLNEIRKTNIARFACDNAEGITNIQPQAFMNVRSDNQPVPCSRIQGMDLSKWRDSGCQK